MYRYTTPALVFRVGGVNLNDVDVMRVALEQDDVELLKTSADGGVKIDADSGLICVALTQEETAAFGVDFVGIQARAKIGQSVIASRKVNIKMCETLDEVVI